MREPGRAGTTRAVLALTLLAGLLRLSFLGAESLWTDEAWSAFEISRSLPEMLRLLVRQDVHPPLYFLLLKPAALLGDSALLLRLPGALFGTLSIPLAYLAGRDLLSRRAGLFMAAGLAVSPFALWFSRDARPYSLLLLLVLLSLFLLPRLARRGGWTVVLLGAVNALVLLTHYLGALSVAAVLLASLCFPRPAGRRAAASALVTALLFLPWLLFARGQFQSVAGHYWIPAAGGVAVLRSLSAVAVLGRHPGLFPLPLVLLLVLPWTAALAWGAAHLGRSRALRVAGLLIAVPVAGALFAGLVRPVLLPRTLIGTLPGFLLLAGWLGDRGGRASLLAALVLLTLLPGAALVYDAPLKEDWRGGVAFVAARAGPGDVVVVDSFLRKAWDHYARRHPRLRTVPVVEIPTRETVPDLFHHAAGRRGAIPEGIWFLYRPSDTEDVETERRLAARTPVTWTFETRTNLAVVHHLR